MKKERGLIILDVDGVLRDSRALIHASTKKAFDAIGIKLQATIDEVWRLKGTGKYNDAPNTMGMLLACDKAGRSIGDVLDKYTSNTDLDKFVNENLDKNGEKTARELALIYREHFNSEKGAELVKMFDYCSPSIKMLREDGYSVAILSNSKRNSLIRDLKNIDQMDIAYTLSSDEISQKKPSGQGITKIMKELRKAQSVTYHVGDTVNDILAARDAGCYSVALISGMGSKEHLKQAKPDYIFKNLLEMSETFTKIPNLDLNKQVIFK